MRKRNIEFLNQAKEKWSSDSIAERRDVVTNFVESVLGQFKVRVQKLTLKVIQGMFQKYNVFKRSFSPSESRTILGMRDCLITIF